MVFWKKKDAARQLESIPVGHYHQVMEQGHPVRRAWHLLKFTRVLEALPPGPGLSLLDIGCFAGSFLSLCPESRFSRQLGVDILPEQIAYANEHFGTPFRRFQHLRSLAELEGLPDTYDCVTSIEVIEHLEERDIQALIDGAADRLNPGGRLVLSTPNYASTWPLLEVLLNRVSDVAYDEQHITRFTYFDCDEKLRRIAPRLAGEFTLEFKTTTHLVAPFLAFAGVERSRQLSTFVEHRTWKVPFGNLVLMSWQKR